MTDRTRYLTLLPLLLALGCAAEKQAVTEEEDIFAMIPAVDLSDDVVYSPDGDMRAALPEEWVALDATRFGNPDIFAVACDPGYSMTIVFSKIPLDQELGRAFNDNGMLGILKAHYDERVARLGAAPPLLVSAEEFAIGKRRFASYLFTVDKGVTYTRVVLFYTKKNMYECSITQLPYTESDLPSQELMLDIHQIVLGGIEW